MNLKNKGDKQEVQIKAREKICYKDWDTQEQTARYYQDYNISNPIYGWSLL